MKKRPAVPQSASLKDLTINDALRNAAQEIAGDLEEQTAPPGFAGAARLILNNCSCGHSCLPLHPHKPNLCVIRQIYCLSVTNAAVFIEDPIAILMNQASSTVSSKYFPCCFFNLPSINFRYKTLSINLIIGMTQERQSTCVCVLVGTKN